jgi:hypothetical protein
LTYYAARPLLIISELLTRENEQVSPVAYGKDTIRLFGSVIDHDDNMERGPHTQLEEGFESTSGCGKSHLCGLTKELVACTEELNR